VKSTCSMAIINNWPVGKLANHRVIIYDISS